MAWRPRHGDEAEERLQNLHARFRTVTRNQDRRARHGRFRRRARTALLAGIGLAVLCTGMVWSYPWPALLTLKHLAAAGGCSTARLLELAPVRDGEPGYWSHLDRDEDGVACEHWNGR